MKPSVIFLIVVTIAAFALAIAGTTDDSVHDQRHLDYAKGFAPYTVKLSATGTGPAASMATAVLISDHWALTAAHVVCDAKYAEVNGEAIDKIVVHPEFDETKYGRNDIALLYREKPFGLNYYPPLSTGDETVGDTVSIAGYGVHGPMSTGYSMSDGRLRAGTAKIERFDGAVVVCPISRGSSPLPYGISPGDSGGPMFCNGKVAGINSFTMRDKGPLKSREGEEQGFARVSAFRGWIEEVTK